MTAPRHSRESGNPVSINLPAIDHLDIWTGAWQKKAGTGRGRNGKLTPYGIQKLRELILELAVRGRLVPQDPNDLPAPRPGKWFVYVLECEDGSLFKGHSQDVLARWKQHATGKGAEWTARHPPKRLVHWEEFDSKEEAIAREKELKTGYGRKWLEREIKAGRTRQAGEPASVLLERIAEEKARLVKEGKIKKQKKMPEIAEEDKPFEPPKGWKWARLQDVAEYIQRGKGPKYADSGSVRVVSQKCIQWSGFELSPSRYVDDATLEKYQPERFLCAGDLLWNSTGTGTVGRVAVMPQLNGLRLVADSHVTVTRPLKVNERFFWTYIASPGIQERIDPKHENALVSGTTKQVELATAAVTALPVPVPPLAEQHRIVAKVDELMALCDRLEQEQTDSLEAHQTLVDTLLRTLTDAPNAEAAQQAWTRIAQHFDTLFTTEHSIDQLKQTILQLAVMGKLVPQDPNDLPAPRPGKWFVYVLECEDGSLYKGHSQDVLARWKQHATGKGAEWTARHPPKRLVHWEEFDSKEEAIAREKELKTGYGRKWLEREIKAGRTRQAGEPASVLLERIAEEKARLVKEGKIKKAPKLDPIKDDLAPFELPENWEWAYVWDISELITSGSRDWAKYYSETGAIFVTMGNLSRGDYKLRMDNIRYVKPPLEGEGTRTRLEANDLLISITGDVGNLGLIPDGFGEAYINQHTCLVRLLPKCRNRYFAEFMRSPFAKWQFDAPQRGIKNSFRLSDVGKILIPIPPLAEQHRIVAKVDELMALCDALKARIQEAETTQRYLADAVVARAAAG